MNKQEVAVEILRLEKILHRLDQLWTCTEAQAEEHDITLSQLEKLYQQEQNNADDYPF